VSVKVPKRVFVQWRKISADSYKVSLDLLLTSPLQPTVARDVLSGSVARVLEAFEARHPPRDNVAVGEEEPWAGQWDVAPVPEGALLIGGYKSDAFEEIVEMVAEDLSREGVRGKLDLYQRPETPREPVWITQVETSVRPIGRRVVNGGDRWAAERAAFLRVIEAATDWCLACRPDLGVTVRASGIPDLWVRRADSTLERILALLNDRDHVTLRSIGEDRFRRMTADPFGGDVTLIEGGAWLHRAGWAPAVTAATEFIQRVSNDLVYAFVGPRGASERRGRLARSWLDVRAYEDRLVADAYPVQLLGPEHVGDLPASEWRTTDLPLDRVLVEHVQPGLWFDEVTLDDALQAPTRPRQAVIERARETFDHLLFHDITDEERDRKLKWALANPTVALPDDLHAKVHAFPATPYLGVWDVALVLRDGSVIEDVELGYGGAAIARIAGGREISVDTDDIVDVIDRSASDTPALGDPHAD
jgi:hypothetical protein